MEIKWQAVKGMLMFKSYLIKQYKNQFISAVPHIFKTIFIVLNTFYMKNLRLCLQQCNDIQFSLWQHETSFIVAVLYSVN